MIDIDFELLRPIGLTQAIANQLHSLDLTESRARLVRVTGVHRDSVTVHDGHTQTSARTIARLEGLAVGDCVLAEDARLTHRLEPLTQLARRSPDGRRQPLASNVDTALLVMGLDHDFKLRRIERYLALVHAAAVEAVVVLTKADIAPDAGERVDQPQRRLPGSVPRFAVNALGSEAPLVLKPWLGVGQTLILLGSSGAGKSTLTNTLTGAAQATGGVRQDDSRGRHTTTARSLHLCAGGACIIDTPGLRSLQPDIDEEALTASFEDIDALAGLCQFRDCRHGSEPRCAVREAVDADRLRNFHKLLREARRGQQTPLERIADRSKWKALVKAVGARNRQKKTGVME
ncbi:MAG: ribosome small subunit-dependent GTPase A [Pseudomonadota bacterium]